MGTSKVKKKKASISSQDEYNNFLESLVEIIDLIPVPLFFKSEGKFLASNKLFEPYTRKKTIEFLDRTVFDIYPKDLAEKFDYEETIGIDKGEEHKYDIEIPFLDGSTHNVVINQTPLFNKNQQLLGSFGVLTDVTNIKQIRSSLRFRYNFEKILLEISNTFINISSNEVDGMIEDSLERIVEFAKADGGVMFQISRSEKLISLTHVFQKSGISNIKKEFQNIPISILSYINEVIQSDKILYIEDIKELPEYAYNEKRIFSHYGIVSIIAVPIKLQKTIISYLGFFTTKKPRHWTGIEVNMLRFAGEVFISALERKKSLIAILYRENILQTITLNLEKFFTSNNWSKNISDLLSSLGKRISASRIFLVPIVSKGKSVYMNYKYEWCDIGIQSLLENTELENIDLNNSPIKQMMSKLYKGEIINQGANELNSATKLFLNNLDVKSVLFIPVFTDGRFWGILGVTDLISENRIWIDVEIEPLKIAARFIGLSIDRYVAIQSLAREEEKFRNIFEKSNDSILIIDFEGNLLMANQKFWDQRFFSSGFGKRESNVLNILNNESRKKFKKRIGELKVNKNPLPVGEYLLKVSDNKLRCVEINSTQIDFQDQKAVLTIMRDITERKEVEKKILETAIQTEERERERFAEDLHDELGPLLSGVKLYISELGSETISDEKRKELSDYLEEMVDEAVIKIRELSNNLMPNVLVDYGLEKGLKAFINKLNLVQKVDIDLQFSGNANIKKHVLEIVIYRIIIELINNSIKHAKANKINIIIDNNHPKRINITYKDDGIGFNLKDQLKFKGGIGLSSLLNRLATVQGKYKFVSKKEEGIVFKFMIPVD